MLDEALRALIYEYGLSSVLTVLGQQVLERDVDVVEGMAKVWWRGENLKELKLLRAQAVEILLNFTRKSAQEWVEANFAENGFGDKK